MLLAPFLSEGYSLDDAESLRRGNAHLAKLDRWASRPARRPRGRERCARPRDAETALDTLGLDGLKLVPTGWFPYDACAHAVYAVAEKRAAPILFHSGIFIDGRSGRYCRPVFYDPRPPEAARDARASRLAMERRGDGGRNIDDVVKLLDTEGSGPAERSRIFAGTALSWLGRPG